MIEKRFLRNVAEARDNGYDLCCVECGAGLNEGDFEDSSMHEHDCPNRGRDRAQEQLDFIERRLRGNA